MHIRQHSILVALMAWPNSVRVEDTLFMSVGGTLFLLVCELMRKADGLSISGSNLIDRNGTQKAFKLFESTWKYMEALWKIGSKMTVSLE